MKLVNLILFFGLIAYALGGACLTDYDTSHAASAYTTRLYTYSASSPKTASTSSSLSFISYNLQSSISDYCVSNPTAQAQVTASADYAGNQEVVQGVDTRCNCNMPKIISDTTGRATRFLMTLPWRTGQYGIAAGSSQNILDTQYYLYSYSGVEQRGLVAIKTQPSALNGKYLWFISTHVEYTVWAARQSQVASLKSWVQTNIIAKDAQAVVVIVGDFNSGPGDGAYTTMSSLFKNAWEVYNGSPNNGYTYPADYPSNRFDHLWFYAPSSVTVTVSSVQVVSTTDSDHRPLLTTLKFSTSGSAATVAPTKAPTKAPTSPAATSAPTKAATSAPAAATKAPTVAATTAPSSGTCSATVTLVTSGATNVVITNTGTKAIKSVTIGFSPSLPSNSWNWVSTSTSNHYTIPSWAYQSMASHGSYYASSGFYVESNPPTPSVVSVSC